MSMLINRRPVDEKAVEAILSELLCDVDAEFCCAIDGESVTLEGAKLIAGLDVEGRAADGIALHGTRWGRRWCAYTTVD